MQDTPYWIIDNLMMLTPYRSINITIYADTEKCGR